MAKSYGQISCVMPVIGLSLLANVFAGTAVRTILLWYFMGMIYEVLTLTGMYAVVICLSLGSGYYVQCTCIFLCSN